MTFTQPEPPPEERLPYEKPVVRSISLVVDQVLGGNCKKTSPPLGSGDALGCITNYCSTSPGS